MRAVTIALVICCAGVGPARADHDGDVPYTQILEPGYSMAPYAAGAEAPTALTFGPDGNLYLATVAGTIFRYRDIGGLVAGPPEPFVTGLNYPLGLTFGPDGAFYVSSVDDSNTADARPWGMVSRFEVDALGIASSPRKVLVDLPQGHAQTNGIEFGPDGLLYVANGSATDDGVTGQPDVPNLSGAVVRFDPVDATGAPLSALRYQGSGAAEEHPVDVVARGLRNNYDLTFRGDDLYMTVNGPETTDPFADDILVVVEDAPARNVTNAPRFGFPGCLYTHDEDGDPVGVPSPHPLLPEHLKTCDGATPAIASFGLHPSANGLDVAPADFGTHGGDIFVAEWGSFSAVPLRGHQIVRVGLAGDGSVDRLENGAPDVEGFAVVPAPIDVVFHEGALYIAEFDSGTVLRVTAS